MEGGRHWGRAPLVVLVLRDPYATQLRQYREKPSAGVAEDVLCLRELHVQMDQAVAAAYGWEDLDLEHGFHQTAQGVRYTISEAGGIAAAAGVEPRAV